MADLLLRDLVIASGGQLTLAAMPPRDADLTMLRRSTAVASCVQPGDLFWALRGPADDGMRHVEEAFARGAAGAVIAGRSIEPWPGKFTVKVDDVRKALWQTASYARSRFKGTVIAVAERPGRLSASAPCHKVLTSQLSGTATAGAMPSTDCFPSDIAALGLLNAHPSHDYVILSIAGREVSDPVETAHCCCPHIGIVTGTDGELDTARLAAVLDALPDDGWGILNGDDAALRQAVQKLPRRTQVLWIGRDVNNDLVADEVVSYAAGVRFTVENTDFSLPGAGRHDLYDALAAVAVAKLLKISPLSISAALANVPAPAGRFPRPHSGGANPLSETLLTKGMSTEAMRQLVPLMQRDRAA